MKYKLFRSPGNLDKAVQKHELVAVETGKNIDDVADALIRAVRDDLAEMPEYAHCETAAYAPEPVQEHRRTSDDCVPKEQISGRIDRPIERKDGQ